MEIKEFVKNIIIDLDQAISEATNKTSREVYFTDKGDNRTVEFDIAVSVEDTGDKQAGAKIKVLELIELGGSGSKKNKNSTVSRIKFGINISPRQKNTNLKSAPVVDNNSAE